MELIYGYTTYLLIAHCILYYILLVIYISRGFLSLLVLYSVILFWYIFRYEE